MVNDSAGKAWRLELTPLDLGSLIQQSSQDALICAVFCHPVRPLQDRCTGGIKCCKALLTMPSLCSTQAVPVLPITFGPGSFELAAKHEIVPEAILLRLINFGYELIRQPYIMTAVSFKSSQYTFIKPHNYKAIQLIT